MKHDERVINFFDVVVTSRARGAPQPPMREVIEAIENVVEDGVFRVAGDRGGNLFHFIGPIAIDEGSNTATILIRSTDKRSPEYGYSDVQSGNLRVLRKGRNEGGDSAAHLVVSLSASDPNTYICALEKVPGINYRVVRASLNKVLKQFYAANEDHFTYPDPANARDREGNIKLRSHKPQLAFEGHVSDELIDDLNNGSILNVELINKSLHERVGEDPYIVAEKFSLLLDVDDDFPRDGRLDRILEAIRLKQAEFDEAKIRFKDETGHSKTVDVNAKTLAIEDAYIQAKRISPIHPPLRMTTDVIVDRISDPMRAMLVRYRDDHE